MRHAHYRDVPAGTAVRLRQKRHLPRLTMSVAKGAWARRRRYTALEFADFIARADRTVADLCIGTDVMVGFPGEGDAEFEETRRLLAESPIAYAHVFKFSERNGTSAATLADRVDAKMQNARSAAIRRLSAEKRRAFHTAHLGRRLRVLFEEQQGGVWFGYETLNDNQVGLR